MSYCEVFNCVSLIEDNCSNLETELFGFPDVPSNLVYRIIVQLAAAFRLGIFDVQLQRGAVIRSVLSSLSGKNWHLSILGTIVAPGITTSNKKLLVTKGIATRSKKLLVAPGHTTSIPLFRLFCPFTTPCKMDSIELSPAILSPLSLTVRLRRINKHRSGHACIRGALAFSQDFSRKPNRPKPLGQSHWTSSKSGWANVRKLTCANLRPEIRREPVARGKLMQESTHETNLSEKDGKLPSEAAPNKPLGSKPPNMSSATLRAHSADSSRVPQLLLRRTGPLHPKR